MVLFFRLFLVFLPVWPYAENNFAAFFWRILYNPLVWRFSSPLSSCYLRLPCCFPRCFLCSYTLIWYFVHQRLYHKGYWIFCHFYYPHTVYHKLPVYRNIHYGEVCLLLLLLAVVSTSFQRASFSLTRKLLWFVCELFCYALTNAYHSDCLIIAIIIITMASLSLALGIVIRVRFPIQRVVG